MPDQLLSAIDIAAPTDTTPTLDHVIQDQAIEKYIMDAGRILETARSHTTVAESLAHHGFDDEEMSIGMAMQAEAYRSFLARHGDHLPERSEAIGVLAARMDKARDEFEDFRLIARAVFPTIADRIALRVTADPLEDLQRFINAAHAAYATAAQPPYAEKISKRGYPSTRLEALQREIDVLATLDTARDIAIADGVSTEENTTDTTDRDRTYLELKEFMKELKGVSRAIFRRQPETLAMLGL